MVLTIVYNTQNYWVFGIFPSSGILENTPPSSPPPSPEDGNRSSFQNVVFSRIPDDRKSPKTQ
jgi:hypothetical protein